MNKLKHRVAFFFNFEKIYHYLEMNVVNTKIEVIICRFVKYANLRVINSRLCTSEEESTIINPYFKDDSKA